MTIVPLHFRNAKDTCDFIRASRLQSFVLLGKQTILVARYAKQDIDMAKHTFGAVVKETPEVLQLIRDYYNSPVDASLN